MSDVDPIGAIDSMFGDQATAMVLLVDDQAMIGEAIRRLLADQPDLVLHVCFDAAAAPATAERVRPTVILQDLVMPGVDGLTLVRAYRASAVTREIPIIVLSSREEPATKAQAFAAGANDYLVKLPDRIELIARLRYHSRAYVAQRQRDAAYRALRASQRELVEANAELQRLNRTDELTSLTNRRYLDEFATLEWRRAERERTPVSVLMIDVDDFKRYNDTHGHVGGDLVLRQVAGAVRAQIGRATDLAGRYGGEEFIVVLPSTPLGGATVVARRIVDAVEREGIAHPGSPAGQVTVSVGVATATPRPGLSFENLVERSDEALYAAKRGGKNRCVAAAAEPLGPPDPGLLDAPAAARHAPRGGPAP